MGAENNGQTTSEPGGVTGKGFRPGQSGNPGGRPRVVKEFRARCRQFMEEEGWELAIQLASTPGRDQRPTLEFLATYAYGKPSQRLVHTGDEEYPVRVQRVEIIKDYGPPVGAPTD